jgi:FkbM family methyltransferase
VKIHNNIAIIPDDTHISKWVKESGRLDHDQSMVPLACQYIKTGSIVIDAGAYIGDHTIAYSRAAGVDGNVFAFEPNPVAFECLEYNMKNLPNVTCFKQGLGSKIESKGLTNYGGNYGINHLTEGHGISITTIDELGMFGVDFIKIDVEGYELEILKGATETLKKFKPVLLIEINRGTLKREGIKEQDIFYFLDRFGYKYKNIYEGQPLMGEQYDIICEYYEK